MQNRCWEQLFGGGSDGRSSYHDHLSAVEALAAAAVIRMETMVVATKQTIKQQWLSSMSHGESTSFWRIKAPIIDKGTWTRFGEPDI